MMSRARSAVAAFAACACVAATCALASGEAAPRRDPTQPPAAYGAQPHAERDPLDGLRADHLVTVDGHRYLMWQGRRYAVGDSVQGARIERIEDSAVWVRTAQGVRKLGVFAGVEKNDRERNK